MNSPSSLSSAGSQPVRSRHRTFAKALVLLLAIQGINVVRGQSFLDPGFENYPVAAGDFLRPATGPWIFANDAAVVEPPAPNSSTGPLSTWSATFAPFEGQQYASTYAGSDTLRQTVTFSTPGLYRIEVHAAAPSGSLTIPGVGTFPLGNGEFTFTLGNSAIGSLQTVTAGSSWSLYEAEFNISAPGDYQLGIRNTLGAAYFINFDGFAIVPEPSLAALGCLGALFLGAAPLRRWFHRRGL